ncbi:MAG: immunoglobulin domain-containing protein [Opitutaceae bacterium]|jgi:hypothetical protein
MTPIRFSPFVRITLAVLGIAVSAELVAQDWIRDTAFSPVLVNETDASDGLVLTQRSQGGYIATGQFTAVDGVAAQRCAFLKEDLSLDFIPSGNLRLFKELSYVFDPAQASTLEFVPLGDGTFLLRQSGGRTDGGTGAYLRRVSLEGTTLATYYDVGDVAGLRAIGEGGAFAWSNSSSSALSLLTTIRFSASGEPVTGFARTALLGDSTVASLKDIAVRGDGGFFARILRAADQHAKIVSVKADGSIDTSFSAFQEEADSISSLYALSDGSLAVSIKKTTGSARLIHIDSRGQKTERYASLPALWIKNGVALPGAALALELRNFPSAHRPVLESVLSDTATDTHSAVVILDDAGKVAYDAGESMGEGIDARLVGALRNGRIAVLAGRALFTPTPPLPDGVIPIWWQPPAVTLFQPTLHSVDPAHSASAPVSTRFSQPYALASAFELYLSFAEGREGRVLLTGPFAKVGLQPRPGIARFLSSGELDSSFVPDLPAGATGPKIAAVAPDSSVLLTCDVLGAMDSDKLSRMETFVVALGSDGSRRAAFSLTKSVAGVDINALCVDASGRILVSYFSSDGSKESDYHIGWLSGDGVLVQPLPTSFQGLYGVARVASTTGAAYASAVNRAVILDDGGVLLSGYFASVDGKPLANLVKITSDGRVDESFKPDRSRNRNWTFKGLDSEERILAFSYEYPGTENTRCLRRLLQDGSADPDFPVVLAPYGTLYDDNGLPYHSIPRTYIDSAGVTQNLSGTSWVFAGKTVAFTSTPFARWLLSPEPELSIYASTTSVVAGNDLVLETKSNVADIVSYQWYQDGRALSGKTGPILAIRSVKSGQAGNYTLRVRRADQSEMSAEVTVTVNPSTTRLAGYSSRGVVLPGEEMITGVVFDRANDGHLLVRSIGRGLYRFNIGSTMLGGNSLACYRHASDLPGGVAELASDKGGILSSDVAGLSAKLGLFPVECFQPYFYPDTNLGSALNLSVQSGAYSFVSRSEDGGAGVCLTEVYSYNDSDATPGSFLACATRGRTGPGGDVLIAGFTISGNSRLKLLIRGIGPSLAGQGVKNCIVDPRLELLAAGDLASSAWINDDWGGDAEIASAMRSLGMAAWAPGSKEAAMLASFDPGAYTVLLRNLSDGVAEGLIEIYVVRD